MKKIKSIALAGILSIVAVAAAQQLPQITITTNTVVTKHVAPSILTAGQVDSILASSSGTNQVSSANLQALNLRRAPDGTNFILTVNVK